MGIAVEKVVPEHRCEIAKKALRARWAKAGRLATTVGCRFSRLRILAVVEPFMASRAQRDQVGLFVRALLTAKLLVMDLEIVS
jgi:hypothetical protein